MSMIKDSDEEISIAIAFDSELNQVFGCEKFVNFPGGVIDERRNAVNWMLMVCDFHRFRPETAYLSVNYFDNFVLAHALPEGKEWPFQLLSVTCVSLAAKMEEINVPLLLDLQTLKPTFFFKPKTIQRMELLVMAALKWRMRIITPFDFLHYFISKLPCYDHRQVFLFASDFVVRTCKVIDLLDYPASVIAAASVLWVTGQNVHEENFKYLHKRVSKEMVERCYNVIKQKQGQLGYNKEEKLEQCNLVPVFDLAGRRSLEYCPEKTHTSDF